ncbi:amino acid permease [Microbacterium trichothecenolyticum]|uniref:amino acid permease n=1 Tax=Microbacterium trichothecenolyticum TaxID=69370 RepID=UPI0035BE81B0
MFSGLGGALLIVGALLAAPSLTDGQLAAYGLSYVITAVLGDAGGRLMLCTVAVAVFACTLAVQTAGARMMYSMSRERAFPLHRAIGRVSPRTGTPISASAVVGVGAAIALVVNFGQPALFTALSSIGIAMIYIAYLGVTAPLLIARIRLRRSGGLPAGVDEQGAPLFTLGRWGLPVNAVAVAFQIAMIVNLAWPRPEIYDLEGDSPLLQWSAIITIGVSLAIGGAYLWWRGRTHARRDRARADPGHGEGVGSRCRGRARGCR